MKVSVVGFGHRIEGSALAFGDVAFLSRGPHTWLIMRVGFDPGDPIDLALAQLSGEVPEGVEFPRYIERPNAQYTTIDGSVVVRPSGPPLPQEMGSLVFSNAGEAFVRTNNGGVEHFSLATGMRGPPGNFRTYYADWEIVQILPDGAERIICQMGENPA